MKDTIPAIEKKFNEMLMRKSNGERLIMGCEMFDDAMQIVKSSVLNDYPDMDNIELLKQIFFRFYVNDFSESNMNRIVSALQKRHHEET
jgi:uncharacterized protein YfkK (UPF0435 family)